MSERTRVVGIDRVTGGWWWLRVRTTETDFQPGQYRRTGAHGELALPLNHSSHSEQWIGGLLPPGSAPADLNPGADVILGPLEGQGLPWRYAAAPLILAEDSGIGPALTLARECSPPPHLVLVGTWDQPPARLCPSRFLLPGLPPEAIAGLQPLEEAGIAARVASRAERPGCCSGDGVTLLRYYLAEAQATDYAERALAACVPSGRLTRWRESLSRHLAAVHVAELPEALTRPAG